MVEYLPENVTGRLWAKRRNSRYAGEAFLMLPRIGAARQNPP